jgi:hypothetical protein
MRSLLLTRIALYLAVVFIIPACASLQNEVSASTSSPAMVTPEPSPAKPMDFVIPAGTFPLDTQTSCRRDASILAVDDAGFQASGTISMINGEFALWCPGAQHSWAGTLSYEGYTFASDAVRPLRFRVETDGSYKYVGGAGTVTQQDGSEITLP